MMITVARWIRLVVLLAVLLAALLLHLLGQVRPQTYHPIAIADLQAKAPVARSHTHVDVMGFVFSTSWQVDGTLQVRLCDGDFYHMPNPLHCIVTRAVKDTERMVLYAKIGKMLHIRGVARFDTKHERWEICPIESVNATGQDYFVLLTPCCLELCAGKEGEYVPIPERHDTTRK